MILSTQIKPVAKESAQQVSKFGMPTTFASGHRAGTYIGMGGIIWLLYVTQHIERYSGDSFLLVPWVQSQISQNNYGPNVDFEISHILEFSILALLVAQSI